MVPGIGFKQEAPRNENLMVNEYSIGNLKSFSGNTFWVAGEIWQNTYSNYSIP